MLEFPITVEVELVENRVTDESRVVDAVPVDVEDSEEDADRVEMEIELFPLIGVSTDAVDVAELSGVADSWELEEVLLEEAPESSMGRNVAQNTRTSIMKETCDFGDTGMLETVRGVILQSHARGYGVLCRGSICLGVGG